MIRKLNLAILLCLAGLVTNAQPLQTWKWDYYKIEFKASDNIVVQKAMKLFMKLSINPLPRLHQ